VIKPAGSGTRRRAWTSCFAVVSLSCRKLSSNKLRGNQANYVSCRENKNSVSAFARAAISAWTLTGDKSEQQRQFCFFTEVKSGEETPREIM
jgi:hypothetical protein